MEDCETNYPSNKLEVIEMFGVNARVRIDLKGVIVVSRVLEQTIERIKHLMRQ